MGKRKRKRKNDEPLKDFYAVLGIARNADLTEIREAFRKLAQGMHPDRNPSPDAKTKFQELGEAYRILKSDEKRKEYDARIIAEYCEALVGSFEEKKKKETTHRSEFHRILGK